jgi:GT2 family glycosyltransferase
MTMSATLANDKTIRPEQGIMEFHPIQILEVELSQPLPNLPAVSPQTGRSYCRADILVRLHTYPLGMIDIEIPESGLSASELAHRIWLSLSLQIQNHLRLDEIMQTESLEQTGLALSSNPPCMQLERSMLVSAPFVSVVIATRDRITSLQRCLQSILSLDYPNFEVIVVDNAPRSTATADFFHTNFLDSAKVRYLREEIPGLAVAHNRALTVVKAPIVAITDDDVVVDSNWLKAIVTNFQQDSQVGCVTGMILPHEIETLPQLWVEQFCGFGKGFQRIVFDNSENRPSDFLFPYTAGKFGSGANMAFRTLALRAVGGFDPALGAGTPAKGADDLAVFFDMITKGYRLVYEPRAILYHTHRADYPSLSRQAYEYGVGPSAFLMRTIINNPCRLAEILLKAPAGLKHFLDPHSSKNKRKQSNFPRELSHLEWRGFLIGPLMYLQSRWRLNKLRGQLPVLTGFPDPESTFLGS